MGVYVRDGVTLCEGCSGPVELFDPEEGWVHKFGTKKLCARQKIQYHAPLRDYIVPTESLRDRMAMAALTGMVARTYYSNPSTYAEASYNIADAMLEERVREKTTEGRDPAGLAGSGVRVPIWPSSAETAGGEGNLTSKPWPVGGRPPEHD